MAQATVRFKRDAFNGVYYDLLDDDHATQILFGGSSSGKSVFKAQNVVYDLLAGGRNYLCCRKVGKTLKRSVFAELTKYIETKGLGALFNINKTDMSVTCTNGYQALLAGLDDVEKIKSITCLKGVITDIWIEEATEITENDLRQLEKRLRGLSKGKKKRMHLTFNPILKSHWIYKRFFLRWSENDTRYTDDRLVILKTTYLDNAFLEQDDIDRLLSESDPYYRDVYVHGNWGVLGDLIFTNWRTEDLLNGALIKTFDIFKNGLDFGYSNDPTALVRVYLHRALKRIYITDEYHNKKVTNDQIAADIKPIIGTENVTCDSAEPKSIQELNNHGISAIGAVKGKDSILHGIQWLQQYEIIVDAQCIYTKGNLEQYHWKKDKEGNVLNVPVDRFNDFTDALRYAVEDEMLGYMGEDMGGVGVTVSDGYEGNI